MGGIVCAISNHKGGVSKTTTAVNLGAALAIQGKRVLLIDNDPQANASSVMIPPNTRVSNSLYELLDPEPTSAAKPRVEDCIYLAKHKGLYILPNVEETSALEMPMVAHYPASLGFLRAAVRDYCLRNFDVTLIDNPPTLSMFVVNSFHAADAVLVPIDSGSAYSLEGLKRVLNLIKEVQINGNPDLRFLRLLINRVDRRTTLSEVIHSELTQWLGPEAIFTTSIPTNAAFQNAERMKQSIFEHDQKSRGANAFRALAKEFAGLINGNGEGNVGG